MTPEELETKYPRAEFGVVTARRDYSYSRTLPNDEWKYDPASFEDKGWMIELPHQCDDWEIGNADAAEELIADISKAIEYCRANP